MNDYPHVIRWAREQPWALMPEKFAVLVDMLRFRAAGGRLTPEEIKARIGEPRAREKGDERRYDPDTGEFYRETFDYETGQPRGYRSQSGEPMRGKQVVSVLSVLGVICQRAAMVDDFSGPGGTSIERLTARYRSSMSDPAVKAIVFDIDSPGGGVYGVQELAEEIRDGRGGKPVEAVANSLAASAAYWIASAADQVAVTPSGEVGSVGVYSAHEDVSAWLAKEGIKVTLVSAGKYKTEGNPFEPLSEEAHQAIQGRVDSYYNAFVRGVARGRGVSPDDVRKGFGQGRVVGAKEAVEAKMADRVDTLDETVRRVGGRSASAPTQAARPVPAPVAGPTPTECAEMEAAQDMARLM